MSTLLPLTRRLTKTALAFRGYNVANLGRTPELLVHPVFGGTVEKHLREASEVTADILHRPCDLTARVRERRETVNLDSYREDVALILAVEAAHVALVEEYFDASLTKAHLAFGYSLGEVGALGVSGVYHMSDLLSILLMLAGDALELAKDVRLGVLFTRGPSLDSDVVHRLCLEVSSEGKGVIGISSLLSPNSFLLLGQGDTIERFQKAMVGVLPKGANLRKKKDTWPPIHTAITWQRAIPNRAGVLLATIPGGFTAPPFPLLSGVTGVPSYNDHNSRELLQRWTDHPMQLWSMILETLASGVDTVLHIGPAPNIIPATFKRLSEAVLGQTAGYSPGRLGMKAVSQIARRPWLGQLLPTSTALLRAPFLRHINLEDWLLEQKIGHAPTSAPRIQRTPWETSKLISWSTAWRARFGKPADDAV